MEDFTFDLQRFSVYLEFTYGTVIYNDADGHRYGADGADVNSKIIQIYEYEYVDYSSFLGGIRSTLVATISGDYRVFPPSKRILNYGGIILKCAD